MFGEKYLFEYDEKLNKLFKFFFSSFLLLYNFLNSLFLLKPRELFNFLKSLLLFLVDVESGIILEIFFVEFILKFFFEVEFDKLFFIGTKFI